MSEIVEFQYLKEYALKMNFMLNVPFQMDLFKRSIRLFDHKADNLQCNTLGRWDERLIDQASDVPSIIIFKFLIDLGHSKLFIFIFVNL